MPSMPTRPSEFTLLASRCPPHGGWQPLSPCTLQSHPQNNRNKVQFSLPATTWLLRTAVSPTSTMTSAGSCRPSPNGLTPTPHVRVVGDRPPRLRTCSFFLQPPHCTAPIGGSGFGFFCSLTQNNVLNTIRVPRCRIPLEASSSQHLTMLQLPPATKLNHLRFWGLSPIRTSPCRVNKRRRAQRSYAV